MHRREAIAATAGLVMAGLNAPLEAAADAKPGLQSGAGITGFWMNRPDGGDVHVYHDTNRKAIVIGTNLKRGKFSDPAIVFTPTGVYLQRAGANGEPEIVDLDREALGQELLRFISGLSAVPPAK